MKRTAGLLIGLIIITASFGQAVDTTALYKQFVFISKQYQQPPLQASIDFVRTTNYIATMADTSTVHAGFSILPDGTAYLQFGDLEQFITDSLVLIVSNGLKRMVLIKGMNGELEKYKKNNKLPAFDSSIAKLMQRYTAEKIESPNGQETIRLSGRQRIKNTLFSKEHMEIIYNTATQEPIEASVVQRALAALPDSSITKAPKLAPYMVKMDGGASYFVKERIEKYIFRKLEHEANTALPVQVSDRVRQNITGKYEPVGSYISYVLSIQ